MDRVDKIIKLKIVFCNLHSNLLNLTLFRYIGVQ